MLRIIIKSILITVIGLFLLSSASQSTTNDPGGKDPYGYFESVFNEMLCPPSGHDLSVIATQVKAHVIIISAIDSLRDDYEYFSGLGTLLMVSPNFIAYVFSHQYRDDPRYDLDFLIAKGDERIAEPQFLSIMRYEFAEYEGPEPEPSETYIFDSIFSFPHLVLGYRGEEAVPYLLHEWLVLTAAEDERYHYFEFGLRASGAKALPYIKQALKEEELSKMQSWTLVKLLNDMVETEVPRIMPGTPYVLDDEGRKDVWQFMFDYFFEHPYELGGRGALFFLTYSDFVPDTDRLIEFLKDEVDPGALSKALQLLRKHITKDDERLVYLIPTVTIWLYDEVTLDAGNLFIGMLTETFSVQIEEPYASAFYPNLYDAFMTTEDDDIAWGTFGVLYIAYQDKIIAEWGTPEIERLLEFIEEFGDDEAFIYLLNELSQRNEFDLERWLPAGMD